MISIFQFFSIYINTCYTDLLIGLVLVPEEATINNYRKHVKEAYQLLQNLNLIKQVVDVFKLKEIYPRIMCILNCRDPSERELLQEMKMTHT